MVNYKTGLLFILGSGSENRSTSGKIKEAMKLILLFIMPLIFIGCSSIYTVKDFSSKEKFYEDFNNSVKNKELEITLVNDSSFSVLEGSKIADDSLDLILNFQNKEHTLVADEIENIKYYGDSYSSPSAYNNKNILVPQFKCQNNV